MENNSPPGAMIDQQEAEAAAMSFREAPSVPEVATIATSVGSTAPLIVVQPDVVEALPGFLAETPVAAASLPAPSSGVLSSVVEPSHKAPEAVDEDVALPASSEATEEVSRKKPPDEVLKGSECSPVAVLQLVETVTPLKIPQQSAEEVMESTDDSSSSSKHPLEDERGHFSEDGDIPGTWATLSRRRLRNKARICGGEPTRGTR